MLLKVAADPSSTLLFSLLCVNIIVSPKLAFGLPPQKRPDSPAGAEKVVSDNRCSPWNSSVGDRQRSARQPKTPWRNTMNLSLILAKVDVLKYHPEWVDGGLGLPGPVFRTAIAEYVVAGLVRDIAAHVTSKE